MGASLVKPPWRQTEGQHPLARERVSSGRRSLLKCLGGGAAMMLGAGNTSAEAFVHLHHWHIRHREALALQAYLYGYAPVAMWATERIQTAVPDTSIQGKAPRNQFAYSTSLVDATETTVVRPNVDTLYSSAWLDLSRQPWVIQLPAVPNRYYVVPFLDAYSNQFASLGSRTTGNDAGDYLIAGPHWAGRVPIGIAGIVRCPTPTVWILARTLVRGPDDLAAAVAVETRYQLVPLNRYGTVYVPPANLPVRPPDPDFVPPPGLPVTSAQGFQSPEFFEAMRTFVRRNPPPRDQWSLMRSFEPVFAHPDALTPAVLKAAQAAMLAAGDAAETSENGWDFVLDVGSYDEDYAFRAAVAATGLGGIVKEDAVYANCSAATDASGKPGAPLTGTNSYTITFPAGQQPPVDGFWSITAYNQSILLIPNSINRYNVGSETGLVPNADGSLTILLQREDKTLPPGVPQPNWLPIPKDAPFSLTLRMYWPQQPVLDGEYAIPAIQAVS